MTAQKTTLFELKSPREVAMAGGRLVVLRGPDRGKALILEREEAVVGTSPNVDLALTDPTVSRHHFSLRVTPDGYEIRDLGSTNGVLLNERRVLVGFIEPGDKLDIGSSRLRFESTRDVVRLPLSESHQFGRLLGQSVAARRLFATLEATAQTGSTVLLLGETGTGKDLAAQSLHEAGPRAAGPFVVFDCSATPASLVESILFGHEAGAFTDARVTRKGLFEEAHGGTLFLDEIGELPKEQQPKLLRAIESKTVRRIGGNATIPVDVRLIAATNRDLKGEVNRGLFREDLFYRLNVITIQIPPLRDRPDDIPLIANTFWQALTGDPHAALSDELLETFLRHSWPGNVRELRARIERALYAGTGEITALNRSEDHSYKHAKEAAIDAFERSFLSALMHKAKGNISEGSRLADMDRVHLGKLLRKYDLHPKH